MQSPEEQRAAQESTQREQNVRENGPGTAEPGPFDFGHNVQPAQNAPTPGPAAQGNEAVAPEAGPGASGSGQPLPVDSGESALTGAPRLPASAANESPALPPSAAVAAAKAHALYSHIVQVARAAQQEIERWVPANVLHAAEREAGLVIRSIL